MNKPTLHIVVVLCALVVLGVGCTSHTYKAPEKLNPFEDAREELLASGYENPSAGEVEALTIARKALLEAGYEYTRIMGSGVEHGTTKDGNLWAVTFDYAPAGGGKHVTIWIEHGSGKVLAVEEGWHGR